MDPAYLNRRHAILKAAGEAKKRQAAEADAKKKASKKPEKPTQ